jgi:hypothetical protein
MNLNFNQSLVLILLLTAGLLGMTGGAFDSATLVPRLAVDVRHPTASANLTPEQNAAIEKAMKGGTFIETAEQYANDCLDKAGSGDVKVKVTKSRIGLVEAEVTKQGERECKVTARVGLEFGENTTTLVEVIEVSPWDGARQRWGGPTYTVSIRAVFDKEGNLKDVGAHETGRRPWPVGEESDL